MLDNLALYTRKNGMEINTDKTTIMIFNKTGKFFRRTCSMGHYFRLYPEVTISLFDALIKPILLYVSDFWGCLKMTINNPIENTHMRFCKDWCAKANNKYRGNWIWEGSQLCSMGERIA